MGRFILKAAIAAAAAVVAAAGAAAKSPPPTPKAAGGRTVTIVARGVPTPTAFAVLAGRVFVSGYGDEYNDKVLGGLYVLGGGKAVRVPGSPAHVNGIAPAGNGMLYLSTGPVILALSGWDGRRFRTTRVIATGPDGYAAFNGLAVGPDGLIYVGANPGTPDPNYATKVLTVDPTSGSISVVATGIRQPWQPLFLPGHQLPLVSDLNQDDLGPKRPPDYVIAIKRGANYGYPTCPANASSCVNYAKPFIQFAAHASPMGLGFLEGKLYIALYGGLGEGSEVVSMPSAGGRLTPFLTGYPENVIAVGTAGGKLYTGDQGGSIYRVTP
jgi:glucose/arabinose dehydrogenase